MEINTYKDIQDALATLARISYDLEEKYIENDGEVTDETEAAEAEKAAIQDLLAGEGIDTLGRWLKSKEDELKTYKAEKEAADRRMKSVSNTIDFVKAKITEVMKATGRDKAKGTFYSFTKAVSKTTKVDTDLLNSWYLEDIDNAMIELGIPNWVTIKLDAKVSEVPVGLELPACFKVDERETVRFTKPRAGKE